MHWKGSEPVVTTPVVTSVAVTVPLDSYMSLRALIQYSGLSRATLQRARYALDHPLPVFRVGRKIVVRRSEFDRWMDRERQRQTIPVEQVLAEIEAMMNEPEPGRVRRQVQPAQDLPAPEPQALPALDAPRHRGRPPDLCRCASCEERRRRRATP